VLLNSSIIHITEIFIFANISYDLGYLLRGKSFVNNNVIYDDIQHVITINIDLYGRLWAYFDSVHIGTSSFRQSCPNSNTVLVIT